MEEEQEAEATPEFRSIDFSATLYWDLAATAAQRSRDVNAANPGQVTRDSIVAILMSAVAAEAFINELPMMICATHMDRAGLRVTLGGRTWIGISDTIAALENESTQILGKYMISSVLLPGDPLRKDKQPYADFVRLVGLRNALVHQKPVTDPPMRSNAASPLKVIADFEQRKWTFGRGDASITSWITKVQTPEIARWACRTASAIILNILDRLGDLADPMDRVWYQTRTDPRISD